jgi:hypothetical protein
LAGRSEVRDGRRDGRQDRRIIFQGSVAERAPAMFSIALLGVAVVIVAEGGLAILG